MPPVFIRAIWKSATGTPFQWPAPGTFSPADAAARATIIAASSSTAKRPPIEGAERDLARTR